MTVIAPRIAYSPPDHTQDRDDALIVRKVPWRDPLVAFAPFINDPVAALLHGDGTDGVGRWSYIAASPFCTLHVDGTFSATIDGLPLAGNPFEILKGLLTRYRTSATTAPAPFFGGAVGFFGYELGGVVERLPAPRNGATCPAMLIGLYDVIAAFDHVGRKAWVMANGFPEQETALRELRAHKRAQWMIDKIGTASATPTPSVDAQWTPEQRRRDVERRVEDTIEYIKAGDIFQANITQRFIAAKPEHISAWDLFRKLRKTLPSPFGAYLAVAQNFHILSASPERFLQSSREGSVETRPIKGTRPRGENPEIDSALADALNESAKDKAENLMIVDLMRNDLSRVCDPGSVTVPQCCEVETFARVHHLVSVVTGRLRPDMSAIDLLRACFPGGSVTGAPKVRAMEIIHELEPTARGPYCGAIAWIGFDGAMDSSIVIRSLVVAGDKVIAQAGGGIVADSVPSLEYEEAMVKLRPLLSVLDHTALPS